MKALVRNELVLLHRLEEAAPVGRAIRMVLKEMKISAKDLTAEDLDQTLGFCAGLPGFSPVEPVRNAAAFTEEAMVLCGFTRKRLDEMLVNFQAAGIPRIALKAMLTETNQNWPVRRLFGELQREHAFFQQQKQNNGEEL